MPCRMCFLHLHRAGLGGIVCMWHLRCCMGCLQRVLFGCWVVLSFFLFCVHAFSVCSWCCCVHGIMCYAGSCRLSAAACMRTLVPCVAGVWSVIVGHFLSCTSVLAVVLVAASVSASGRHLLHCLWQLHLGLALAQDAGVSHSKWLHLLP
jgi:hypothetical protein